MRPEERAWGLIADQGSPYDQGKSQVASRKSQVWMGTGADPMDSNGEDEEVAVDLTEGCARRVAVDGDGAGQTICV